MAMIAVCVDDDRLTMEAHVALCRQIPGVEDARGFTRPSEALAWLENHSADLALLDTALPEMNGIALGVQIKQRNPRTAILFVTAHRESAFEAYAAHPVAYLLKPLTLEALRAEMPYAFPGQAEPAVPRVMAHTFGEFELLLDGAPVTFSRSKAKELLAYLVDRRGGSVTRAAVFAALFEDELYTRKRQKYLDVIIRSLRETLEQHGIGDILEVRGGTLRICPEKLDSDVYRFFQGDRRAVEAYRGEYMNAYSWSNMNEAYLDWLQQRGNA